jgi:hypothetical protein
VRCGSPTLATVFKGLHQDPCKNGHRDKAAHVIYGFLGTASGFRDRQGGVRQQQARGSGGVDAVPAPAASQPGVYQHPDDLAGAVGARMAGPFDGGRPARLDAFAVGTRESVRDVHAEHGRAITAGTGRVTVEATWPKCRPSLPRGLKGMLRC